VADIMGEITAASQEQSSGIEEVNRAISQMDEMTQQNAALVEQAAAAAESMQEQAVKLAQAVSVFKLGAEQQSMAAFAAPAVTGAPVQASARQLSADRPAKSRSVAVAVPKSKAPAIAPGTGDEWEEF
jgi:hypothetical protein